MGATDGRDKTRGLDQLEQAVERLRGFKPESDIAETIRMKIVVGCTREIVTVIEDLTKVIDNHQQTSTALQRVANELTNGIKKLTFWLAIASIVGAIATAIEAIVALLSRIK